MKKYKHTFCGNSSNDDIKFEDEFETIFDDSNETIAVSKNEYTCGLNNKTIYYRIGIRLQNGLEFSDEQKIFAEVLLIPSYRSIHKEQKESIFSSIGDPNLDMKEWGKSYSYYLDAVFEDTYVCIADEQRKYDFYKDNTTNYDEVQNKILDDFVNVYTCYHGLIGFYLDKPVNRIGMDGWDYLRQFCNNLGMKTILKELKKRYA